ncbi:hypothetical protein HJC23_004702 [Cyclotella cryptica]|uniref:Methyltransferase FkbM domain-containing protein n=1 Tax=Cyclotella cryptica TaxID=29204 RepID=A0ABD3PTU9_9STRA|eukprot:CCRYP_012023-RA/>CCRYP_012023-RA protein AED:0.12 eAED:0.12 QI:0/-1/0/1/-1/1/1/0/321
MIPVPAQLKGNYVACRRQNIIAAACLHRKIISVFIILYASWTAVRIHKAKAEKKFWDEKKKNYPRLSLCVPDDLPVQTTGEISNSSMKTSARKAKGVVKVPEHFFKSQSKEDKKLMGWFGNLCGGTYIEMGGADGVFFSNSFVFNKALSWKGVLIELSTSSYNQMIVNRPDEIATVHAGVCKEPQKLHAVNDGLTGGIYEFAAPSFIEQWWKDLSFDDPKVEEIECDTMDNILRKNAPTTTYFDFFSLDVEGAELAVLESIDFERVKFGIIFAEADKHNERKNLVLKQFLERKGYSYLYHDHPNDWFVNPDFDEIYGHLVY